MLTNAREMDEFLLLMFAVEMFAACIGVPLCSSADIVYVSRTGTEMLGCVSLQVQLLKTFLFSLPTWWCIAQLDKRLSYILYHDPRTLGRK